MTPELVGAIEETLSSAESARSIKEIADELGLDPDAVAQSIWDSPDRFAWQPGGRWTLATPKRPVRPPADEHKHDDTRPAVLSPQDGVELRALTLASGIVLRVTRRPLDTPALFSVQAVGRDLRLVLNASHEAFETLPMPFDDESGDNYKRLTELLLAAWTAWEAVAPPASKRALEDARFMWGRNLLDLIHSER